MYQSHWDTGKQFWLLYIVMQHIITLGLEAVHSHPWRFTISSKGIGPLFLKSLIARSIASGAGAAATRALKAPRMTKNFIFKQPPLASTVKIS
jgi:glucose dehydrogenase